MDNLTFGDIIAFFIEFEMYDELEAYLIEQGIK